MALFWSRKSRAVAIEKEKQDEERNRRLIGERITVHSLEMLKTHPELDFLLYGHYHYPIDQALTGKARQVVLGDWLTHFTYAVFDGSDLRLLTW
jgi:UDP-2,3-diacylglucosamine hydrolase